MDTMKTIQNLSRSAGSAESATGARIESQSNQARTPGALYRIDDRFHAGRIVTAGEDDGMLVCTFSENVPTVIQENILEACNSHDRLTRERDEAVALLRRLTVTMLDGHAQRDARAFLSRLDGKDGGN